MIWDKNMFKTKIHAGCFSHMNQNFVFHISNSNGWLHFTMESKCKTPSCRLKVFVAKWSRTMTHIRQSDHFNTESSNFVSGKAPLSLDENQCSSRPPIFVSKSRDLRWDTIISELYFKMKSTYPQCGVYYMHRLRIVTISKRSKVSWTTSNSDCCCMFVGGLPPTGRLNLTQSWKLV